MSIKLVNYVLRAAVRDRILVALLIALLISISLSTFLGSGAVIEKGQFAGVFTATGLRTVGILAIVLFTVFYIRRSFEARDIEFLLSRPISRTQLLLSFSFALSLIALLTAALEGLCLLSLGVGVYDPGVFLWMVSIAVEAIIMVNVALFFSLFISSASVCALACFGFYILARLMGQILGIVDSGTQAGLPAAEFLARSMEIISAVFPRLDLMGQTSWLMYGPDDTVGYGFLLTQGFVFTALVLIAARIDLGRRVF